VNIGVAHVRAALVLGFVGRGVIIVARSAQNDALKFVAVGEREKFSRTA
jgi:hypothetical protein